MTPDNRTADEKYIGKKKFTIHRQDAGSEAYRDEYVGWLESRIAELTRKIAEQTEFAVRWHRLVEAIATILEVPSTDDAATLGVNIQTAIDKLRAANEPKGLLARARDWIGAAPHGDNCFVSNNYAGDPGNRCNCGKDSMLAAFDEYDSHETKDCPGCDGKGWYALQDRDGEPQQVQCHWCHATGRVHSNTGETHEKD